MILEAYGLYNVGSLYLFQVEHSHMLACLRHINFVPRTPRENPSLSVLND